MSINPNIENHILKLNQVETQISKSLTTDTGVSSNGKLLGRIVNKGGGKVLEKVIDNIKCMIETKLNRLEAALTPGKRSWSSGSIIDELEKNVAFLSETLQMTTDDLNSKAISGGAVEMLKIVERLKQQEANPRQLEEIEAKLQNLEKIALNITSRIERELKEFTDEKLEAPVDEWIYNRDGSNYKGEFVDGKMNGIGTLIYSDNSPYKSYEGDFKDGLKHGHGRLEFTNGVIYRGEFAEDTMNGRGTMIYSDNSPYKSYEGDVKDGVANGQGILKFSNGAIYNGGFLDGKMNGLGTLVYSDNSPYESFKGDFKDGELHKGIRIHYNGSTEEGSFQNDRLHGVGTLNYGAGNFLGIVDSGEFKNGVLRGKGKRIFAPKSFYKSYEGEFLNGNPNGKGKRIWKNGAVDKGQFFNGVFQKS